MASSNTIVVSPCPTAPKNLKSENEVLRFDLKSMHEETVVPKEFIWSSNDLAKTCEEELYVPIIDLKAIQGDEAALVAAAELVRETCIKHGFFIVTNHGVDPNLINAAYDDLDSIFKLPLNKKCSVKGYSNAHSARFNSSLPWKETLTFLYDHLHGSDSQVIDYFNSQLGENYQQTGLVYQKYCDAMKELCEDILELLGVSLGVDRLHYKKFYEDAVSMMRLNYYPPCSGVNAGVLGTGPHCDPTSITLLYQDQVGGLEIFVDDKWFAVHPQPNTFVINIGDTFKAMTNGIYKSCLHRVLSNKDVERKTLAFFLNSKEDKTVRPPNNLFGKDEPRNYPDFTWSQFFEFTQKHFRSDANTLQEFVSWFSSKPSNI